MDFGSKKTKQEKGVRKSPGPLDMFDANQLSIPNAIKDEAEAGGYDLRWINMSNLQKFGGVHKHRWEIFRPKGATQLQGKQSDGSLRRGDLVLAVRKKEITTAYKARVDERNRMNQMYSEQSAKELEDRLRDGGVRTKVAEGYGEDE